MSEEKRLLRSNTVKVKLTEIPEEFKPRHRSTDIPTTQQSPFEGRPRVNRSPIRSLSPIQTKSATVKKPIGSTSGIEDKLSEHPEQELKTQEVEEDEVFREAGQERTPQKNSKQTLEKILGESYKEKMANTTIEETLQRTLQPATPKFIPPPTFNPGTDNASVFLRTYERTAIANGWDNSLKISYFGTFLEGAANIWYNRFIENEDNHKKT
ncbi:hypothetical protein JTB14_011447 [Gonioctena quinquepunctata]|nr:hypothetical protein JTB14_011447 [Gonioctena quinquepunctata]